jgi:NADH dehydrogenase
MRPPAQPEPTRVVLLGGGYATLHAYRTLVRRLRSEVRSGLVELIVLSADDAHSFHGFTGEVLAGLLPFELTRTRLAEAMPAARVLHATVKAVDVEARVVSYCRAGAHWNEEMRYDELVVGIGGLEPLRGVPGLAEHGHSLRGPGGIERLTQRIHDVVGRQPAGATRELTDGSLDGPPHDKADTDPRPGTTETVVVAGGGLAGVELAAAIADGGGAHVRVLLVHAGDTLAPRLAADHPRLSHYTVRQLTRLGVDVRLNTRLVAVAEEYVVLSDGSRVTATTVLGTVGQRAVVLAGLDQLPRDPGGRLVTADDLSVAPGIWAAGDVALVRHPQTGDPVPANALWAIKAGGHVGRNVARTLRGRHTVRFRYRGLGQAASFGLGRSVAELYGVPFTGWLAWLLRLVFFLRFMPSRRNAVGVLRHTLRTVVRGGRPGYAAGLGSTAVADLDQPEPAAA